MAAASIVDRSPWPRALEPYATLDRHHAARWQQWLLALGGKNHRLLAMGDILGAHDGAPRVDGRHHERLVAVAVAERGGSILARVCLGAAERQRHTRGSNAADGSATTRRRAFRISSGSASAGQVQSGRYSAMAGTAADAAAGEAAGEATVHSGSRKGSGRQRSGLSALPYLRVHVIEALRLHLSSGQGVARLARAKVSHRLLLTDARRGIRIADEALLLRERTRPFVAVQVEARVP